MKFTPADREALAKMPDNEWFLPSEIRKAIDRPWFRCQRLREFGYLEYRTSDGPCLQYHKTPKAKELEPK